MIPLSNSSMILLQIVLHPVRRADQDKIIPADMPQKIVFRPVFVLYPDQEFGHPFNEIAAPCIAVTVVKGLEIIEVYEAEGKALRLIQPRKEFFFDREIPGELCQGIGVKVHRLKLLQPPGHLLERQAPGLQVRQPP